MVYYVALPFIPIEGGLAPGEAVECPNGAAAIRRAHAMSFNEANAVRSPSPAAGIRTLANSTMP